MPVFFFNCFDSKDKVRVNSGNPNVELDLK